jgi:Holliday junction resolvasome RuvABC ATP-dependent DNA helicase subunit
LDVVIRRAADAASAVIFIDEVHGLAGIHSHKLYELLENQRYKFQDEDYPTLLPNVTLLAATTDYGQLHPALQRRWIKHYFEPATPLQLAAFLRRRATNTLGCTEAAIQLIVDRTKLSGQPWEAVELFRLASVRARADGLSQIDVPQVQWVLTNQGIDTLGLRRIDRQVIEALLTRKRVIRGETVYGASESDTCLLARVDKAEYRETIRPKLMVRGLLQMRSGVGQALTDAAVARYGP